MERGGDGGKPGKAIDGIFTDEFDSITICNGECGNGGAGGDGGKGGNGGTGGWPYDLWGTQKSGHGGDGGDGGKAGNTELLKDYSFISVEKGTVTLTSGTFGKGGDGGSVGKDGDSADGAVDGQGTPGDPGTTFSASPSTIVISK